jgi:uncharacterized membrane protein YbhN (UPF0104 family)
MGLTEIESNAPPRRHGLGWLLRLGLLALGVLAVARMVRPADLERAAALMGRVGWPLLLVLLPAGFAMSLDAQGWRLVLAAIGHRVPWRPMVELRLAVEAVLSGLPAGAVAGEAMKLALLRRRAGVPLPAGTASLALTKVCLMSGEAIYLLLGVAVLGATALAGHPPPTRMPFWLGLGGAAALALVSGVSLLLLRNATLATRVGRWFASLPSARLRRWAEARQAGFEELDRAARGFFEVPARVSARCVVPFVLEWLVEGLETLLILRLLGVGLGFGGALVTDGVSSLVRAVVFVVPGGLGFQDAAEILMLGSLGVPDAAAVGAALIFVKRSKEIFWVLTGASFLAIRKELWSSRAATRGDLLS